jgi:hypothetical protein
MDDPANAAEPTPAEASTPLLSAVDDENETAATPTAASAVVRRAIENVLDVPVRPRRVPTLLNLQ